MNKMKKSTGKFILYFALMTVLFISTTGCSDGSASTSSPQDSNVEKRVLIDPAHGGADLGAIFIGHDGEVNEKDLNLKVSLLLDERLNDSGINSAMTRQEDQELSLDGRMASVTEQEASLLLSIHFDNGPNDSNTMVVQYNSLIDPETAQTMHDQLKETLGLESAKLIPMAENLKFSSLEIPAITVDLPFMITEPDNAKNLSTEESLSEIANALNDGVLVLLNEL